MLAEVSLRRGQVPICLALLLAVPACAVPRKGGFEDVSALVGDQAGRTIHWYQGTPEDEEAHSAVRALLAGELSADAAVQVALLNNRRLQVIYEDLGVAQADLVQAGLLTNPVFMGSVRYPDRSSAGRNTEFGVAQSFLDIFMRPARKRLAEAGFEAEKMRVAAAVLDLAAETQAACFRLQGALQTTAMLRLSTEAAGAAHEFARRQRAAGNISDLEMFARQSLLGHAQVELARSEVAVVADREALTRLMGLTGENGVFIVPSSLQELPEDDGPLHDLERQALDRRPELAAQRWEIEALARALKVTLRWRWVPLIDVGVSTERDPEGTRVTGPEVAIALPLFDRGQAGVARIEALLRQSRQRLVATAVDISSEVREARSRLIAARELAGRYRSEIIPLNERLVAETQKFHNFMLAGVYQLLEARRDEIDAYRGYIEAVRDYWIARSDLERAVGGWPGAAMATEPLIPSPSGSDPHEGAHLTTKTTREQ
jgi:cobalt-zinc-cadmium efflux system outer membrane protein